MRRFGELSAAVALQMLVPLLIVLLAFGALAGERERGTLRQVLSLGVTPRALVFGKTLGLGVCVAALLTPGVIVLGVLFAQADASATSALGVRALALAICYGLYLSIFVVGSVAVSALARTGRTALTVLLVFWALNCIVAPRLASDVVHHFLPTPKLAQFEGEMQAAVEQGLDGHDARSERLQEFAQRTLAEHKKTRVEDLPFNFQGLVMLESERMAGEVFDHHFGLLWDRLQAQDRAVAWAGIAAPMLALRSASMAFAGTDFAHHRNFARAAEEHRRNFVQLLNEDLMNNAIQTNPGYSAGPELWEKLPVFAPEPIAAHELWRGARRDILVLAGWLAAALGLLTFSATRLRVGGQ
jgi:ABC-2 type transport system permease protein